MKEFALTTYDNPINPFTDFAYWMKLDLILGHNCCSLLARNAATNDLASEEVNDEIIAEAMNEIVRRQPMIYRIVVPEDYHERVS